MPQILDGKSGRWSLYQTSPLNKVIGLNSLPMETQSFAQCSGAHGGVYLASLYVVCDPTGQLVVDTNNDKFIFVYDANATMTDADLHYPRIIQPIKSKASWLFNPQWEQDSSKGDAKGCKGTTEDNSYDEGLFVPFMEGVRVYLSSTMSQLTPLDPANLGFGVLGITQCRVMLCSCA